jgi:hypothetical protein
MKIKEISSKIGIAYIDLDGVLAWLDKGVADYNNISLETQEVEGWDNKYWYNVLNNSDIEQFFTNLEWERNGKKLINWFLERNLPITLLSRPVKEPNTEACILGKIAWIQKQGISSIPVIFEKDKEKYAISDGKVNILIDDHSGNIEKWNSVGGIGIHYRDQWFEEVIKKLDKLYY